MVVDTLHSRVHASPCNITNTVTFLIKRVRVYVSEIYLFLWLALTTYSTYTYERYSKFFSYTILWIKFSHTRSQWTKFACTWYMWIIIHRSIDHYTHLLRTKVFVRLWAELLKFYELDYYELLQLLMKGNIVCNNHPLYKSLCKIVGVFNII